MSVVIGTLGRFWAEFGASCLEFLGWTWNLAQKIASVTNLLDILTPKSGRNSEPNLFWLLKPQKL